MVSVGCDAEEVEYDQFRGAGELTAPEVAVFTAEEAEDVFGSEIAEALSSELEGAVSDDGEKPACQCIVGSGLMIRTGNVCTVYTCQWHPQCSPFTGFWQNPTVVPCPVEVL